MPGKRLMRVPWLSSAYSKPRSRISRNIARPSECRWEFQQVESEYISGLHVRVARAQHRGKTGRLLLAPAFLAWFFEVPMVAHRFERPFAVDLLLQSPQGLLHGLAFFQFNFGQ